MYLECCEYVLCVCVEYVVGWYVVVVVCEFELQVVYVDWCMWVVVVELCGDGCVVWLCVYVGLCECMLWEQWVGIDFVLWCDVVVFDYMCWCNFVVCDDVFCQVGQCVDLFG